MPFHLIAIKHMLIVIVLEKGVCRVGLNVDTAKQYKNKIVKFQNEDGNWVIGKVIDVTSDGLKIEEYQTQTNLDDGISYGLFGPRRPYIRPRPFGRPIRPYRPYGTYPFTGVYGLTLLPFLFF